MGALKRRVAASAHAARELAAVLWVASKMEWSIRAEGIERSIERAGARVATQAESAEPVGSIPGWAVRRARLVNRVYRYWPFGDTCLRRSLVIAQRLSPLKPSIVFAARMENEALTAHSWVRVRGVDLEDNPERYQILEGFS